MLSAVEEFGEWRSSTTRREVADFFGEVILSAIDDSAEHHAGIARAFLAAVSQNFIPISESDANSLATCLIERYTTSMEGYAGHSESNTAQSSPMNVHHKSYGCSPGSNNGASNGGNHIWRSNADQLALNLGLNDGGGGSIGQQVASFEEESVESLERQEIAFKLIALLLEKFRIDAALLEQVRLIGKKQIQSMSIFL